MAYENTGYLAFANALSNAGQTFGNALEERYKRQSLAALAPLLQQQKYGEAGAAMMELDPKTGIALLEKQRQTDEFNKLYPQGADSVSGASTAVSPPTGQPLDLPGSKMNNGKAIYDIAIAKGAQPNEAALLASAAGAESNYNPAAVHDNGTGYGLFGHRLDRRDAMFNASGTRTPSQEQQVQFALNELRNRPEDKLALAAKTPEDLTKAQMFFERPRGFTEQNPMAGDNYSGRLALTQRFFPGAGTVQSAPIQVAQTGETASDASGGLLSSPELKAQYNRARWTILNPNMPESAKEAAKLDIQNIMTIAREDRQGNKPTEAQRNYNLAKQQGYGGSFMDYQAQTKGGTTVNVGPNEGEFAKKAAAKQADRFSAISEEGDTARNDLALIGQLGELGRTIGTGGGAAAQSWLAERGIKVGQNVGQIEAYQAIIDKLTPSQRVPGSGTTSDRDLATFKSSLPSLIRTPEGNAIIERVLTGMAQSKVARADIADRVLSGELSAKDGVAEMRKLPNPFDVIKGEVKTAPDGTGKPLASNLPPPPNNELEEVRSALANAKTPQIRDAILSRFRQRGTEMRFNTDGLGF